MEPTFFAWAGLVGFVIVAFVVDFFFFQSDHETPPSPRRSLLWSIAWVAVALLFGAILFVTESSTAGSEYLTGYLLERSLSLDNVFVFSLIFAAMAVPTAAKQDVLEVGIILALVLRFLFILAGASLVEAFDWVLLIFGAFLVYTGIKMATSHGNDDIDPEKNIGVRLLSKVMPVTQEYDGSKYTTKIDGKRMATPLLAVVAAVATADVIFAVDSIPAIFGVTTDTYIVFAANAFALLGLRALFALLEDAKDRFVYLTYGLAAILVFIGIKMLIEDFWHMPTGISLGGIAIALTVSIVLSLRATDGKHGPPPPSATPPGAPA